MTPLTQQTSLVFSSFDNQNSGLINVPADINDANEPTSMPSLEDELVRVYNRIFEVAEQRARLSLELKNDFIVNVGFGESVIEEALCDDKIDELSIAKDILRSLISPTARMMLGINSDVDISSYDDFEQFLNPLIEAKESLRRSLYSDDVKSHISIPRLDIRSVIAFLKEKYAGDAGEVQRIGQVVAALRNALDLDRTPFDIKSGKATIEFHTYCSDYYARRGEYDSEVYRKLGCIASGLVEMYIHFGEEIPHDLGSFRNMVRHVRSAETWELGRAIKLRTFKQHMRLTMTEGVAEKLREFLVEYSLALSLHYLLTPFQLSYMCYC